MFRLIIENTMTKRYVNKLHLSWIHNQRCIVGDDKCQSPLQAHHLLKPFDGIKGMGRKSNDKNLVPLCLYHHTELHTMGSETKFSQKYFGDSESLKVLAQQFWLKSPYYE